MVPHLKLASHATRQPSRKPSLRASPHKEVLASKIMSANSCGRRTSGIQIPCRSYRTPRQWRATAQELDVVHGAVSQQVRGLEEMLGIEFFEKKGRRRLLTQHDQRYSDAINVAFGIIERAGEEMRPAGSAPAFRLGMRSPGRRPTAFIVAISIAFVAIDCPNPNWPSRTPSARGQRRFRFGVRERPFHAAAERCNARGASSLSNTDGGHRIR
jgi:hypothetical protein